VVSTAIFVLYLVTLAPSIGLWDAGEYVAAAAGFGIPHPPGNPGFVILGRVISLLPIARTVAERLNVLVAFASALSAGLWFLIAEHVGRRWLGYRRALVAAAASAVVGASAFTVWNQSVVNEKVYTISLLLLTFDLWTTLLWQMSPDGRRADRRVILLCYRLGIGYTIHIAGLLAGPALLAAVLYTRPRMLRRARFLAACGAAFVIGLTPYVTLPIRAAFPIAINEGHPTACEDGRPHWKCTVSTLTLDRFLYENNRTQYAKPSLLLRQQTLVNQVRMWWMYFKWQWFRDPAGAWPNAQAVLAVMMILLAATGGYAHWRYDRRSFVPVATLVATLTIGLIYYLNFKLGYSQAMAMGVADPRAREVRDRDYFYLWSYSALSLWIGLGIGLVWNRLAAFFGADAGLGSDGSDRPAGEQTSPRIAHWWMASPVLAIAFVPLALNWHAASRHRDTFAEDFAIDALNSLEPNAVLFTGGDNDSFPLWYAQQVLGVRRDVSVVLLAYLSTDWYVKELLERSDPPYDPANGPDIYKSSSINAHGPLLTLTRGGVDSLPARTRLSDSTHIALGSFAIAIPPGSLRRGVVVMLRIIQDAGRDRPIYFSAGAGIPTIGPQLEPHLVTQGLSRKLVANPANEPGVVRGDEGYLDLPRAVALWNGYRAPERLAERGRWVDAASANMPYLYMRLGFQLIDAMESKMTIAEKLGFADAKTAAKPDGGVQTPRGADDVRFATDLRRQLERLSSSIDFIRLVSGRRTALDAPNGLGYAPVESR